MVSYPKIGMAVRIRYSAKTIALHGPMPLQDAIGIVEIASRGKPHNHGVRIDGVMYVVPCGNLQSVGVRA